MWIYLPDQFLAFVPEVEGSNSASSEPDERLVSFLASSVLWRSKRVQPARGE